MPTTLKILSATAGLASSLILGQNRSKLEENLQKSNQNPDKTAQDQPHLDLKFIEQQVITIINYVNYSNYQAPIVF